MQHDPPTRTSPMLFFDEGQPPPASANNRHPLNFAETLPMEMSLRIFGELDAESLCRAARTCRLWRHIIEDSEQLWRRQCLLVRAVCQREVDGDRKDGLSWKSKSGQIMRKWAPGRRQVTLVRNYSRSCLKRDWLIGRYSQVRSVEELAGRQMTPLDAETWGEILQAELDR